MNDNIDKDEIRRAIDRLQAEHPVQFPFDVTRFNDDTVFNEIQRAIDIVAKKCADDAEIHIICEMAKLYLDGVKPTIDRPVPPGYKLVKCPNYDCSCIVGYPNKSYCRKNGHWKCIDDYEYVGISKQGMTHCRRKKK